MKIKVSVTPRDLARLRRRADELRRRGDRSGISGAIRYDAAAAQRLRHDLRGPLGTISLIVAGIRAGVVDSGEVPAMLERAVKEMQALVAEEHCRGDGAAPGAKPATPAA